MQFTPIVEDMSGDVVGQDLFNVTETSGPSLDGSGTIEQGQSDQAKFEFIPSLAAALNGPTDYKVGGVLTFDDASGQQTVNLAPVTIEVLPQPVLNLDYFWSDNALGPDPFNTSEPSQPFQLGVEVHNVGAGDATNLSITSAQPNIVSNLSGLEAPFTIVGSSVDGVTQKSPSLTANFGTLGAGASNTAVFDIQSSLQGIFSDFNATFQNLDGLGKSEDSIVQQVNIHSLVQGGDFLGNGQTDFLTNDGSVPATATTPAINAYQIYFSNGTEDANVGSPTATLGPETTSGSTVTIEIDVSAKSANWDYVSAVVPWNPSYTLLSVKRADGSELSAGHFWYTDRTFTAGNPIPTYQDTVNFVDNAQSTAYFATFAVAPSPPTVAITTPSETTDQATQTIAGTVTTTGATPGSIVTIYDNGAQVGTATLTGGSWSTSVNLTKGSNSIMAQDTDAAGNTGVSSPVAFTLESQATATINTLSPIVFGNVRVGGTDSEALSITNSATAPAEALDVSVGGTSGAVTGSGSFTGLAATSTDASDVTVGLSTLSAGAQNGAVTLNLSSDAGGGVTSPLPSRTLQVSGNVYREATASIAPLPSDIIVHVGDTVSDALSIANTAASDGYSENLIASVTGVSAGLVTSNLTTGDIAAGTSSSAIALGISTAAAGGVSGSVTLDLQSDGTGIDGLGALDLGQQTINVNATVDNYAIAALQKVSGAGTLSGDAANGYALDLGTVQLGASAPTISLAALNAATGQADLLEGSFVIGGADPGAFSDGGFGPFSELAAGQSDTGLNVALNTSQAGTFSETITFDPTGYNASGYSGALAPETLTVTGLVQNGVSVAYFLAHQTALDAQGPFTVADNWANVLANLAKLNADAKVASIALTDATAPVMTLTVAQALASPRALGALSSGSASWSLTSDPVIVSDTAAQVNGLTGAKRLALAAVNVTTANGYTSGVLTESESWNASGSYDIHYFTGGTFNGVAYASYDNAYTSSGFRSQESFYDTSDNVVAFETFQANGGYAITLNGALWQQKTVNTDGTYDVHYYQKGGSFQGVTYAGYDVAYTKANVVTQQTYFDLSGNVLAYETFAGNGGYSIYLGGQLLQAKTVNADGSYDIHYFTGGTFNGVAYASYDNAYTSSGFRSQESFYDTSDNVVAFETFQANGGYAITLNGALWQQKTVNTDGTYDVHYYQKGGSFQGVTYAGYDVAYTKANVVTQQTYFDLSGNVLAYETFAGNGGYSIYLGGQLLQAKTVNADGSYDIHYNKGGTFNGVAYASYDNAYTSSGFRSQESFYDTSDNVVAFETFQANGGYAITLNGALWQQKTVNTDGTYDVHYYQKGGSFQGVTYAGYDVAYTKANVVTQQTYFDLSGNVLAYETFAGNGGYSIYVGGQRLQAKTVNADGSYDIHYYKGGTFNGVAYASYDNAYTSSGFRSQENFYDTGDNLVAFEIIRANGDYAITVGGLLKQQKTVNVDNSYDIAFANVTGQSYGSYENIYSDSGARVRREHRLPEWSRHAVALWEWPDGDGGLVAAGRAASLYWGRRRVCSQRPWAGDDYSLNGNDWRGFRIHSGIWTRHTERLRRHGDEQRCVAIQCRRLQLSQRHRRRDEFGGAHRPWRDHAKRNEHAHHRHPGRLLETRWRCRDYARSACGEFRLQMRELLRRRLLVLHYCNTKKNFLS